MKYIRELLAATETKNTRKIIKDILRHEYVTPEINDLIRTLTGMTSSDSFNYDSIRKSMVESLEVLEQEIETLCDFKEMNEEYQSIDLTLFPVDDPRLTDITMAQMKTEESIQETTKTHELTKCKIMIFASFLIKGDSNECVKLCDIIQYLVDVDSLFENEKAA